MKTHCFRGHALSEANIYIDAKGRHVCKQCRYEIAKKCLEKNKRIYMERRNEKRRLMNLNKPPKPSVISGFCKNGHQWTESNTGRNSKGARYCMTCREVYRARNKEKFQAYNRANKAKHKQIRENKVYNEEELIRRGQFFCAMWK